MVPEAHAQYSTVLNPNSCVLYNCGKHCFEQYKGTGQCLQKTGGLNPTYDCNCVYTCGPKHELKNFAYVINKQQIETTSTYDTVQKSMDKEFGQKIRQSFLSILKKISMRNLYEIFLPNYGIF